MSVRSEHSQYEEYEGDFDRSLLSSTPRHTGSKGNDSVRSRDKTTRSRKTASITSEADNSTFYKSDQEDETYEPQTEWEKWILKKAKELSFCQEQEKDKRREERRKRREEKRAKREKLKVQEKVIEDWNRKKLEEHKIKIAREQEKQEQLKNKKAADKEEILEKSVLAVKEWEQKKTEELKNALAKKIAEQEREARLKDERREKAKQKYNEWLKNHKPSPSPKHEVNRPKTLSDVYPAPKAKQNPKPWVSETDIAYEKVKILYTPF